MLKIDRPLPLISLVVRWPKQIPAEPLPKQLLRQLSESRLAATWAIETPAQAYSLMARGIDGNLIEAAVMVADSEPTRVHEAVYEGLNRFDAAGLAAAAIQVGASLPRASVERLLRQSGVRAIIISNPAARVTTIRPLPFGVWEFQPHLSVPNRRRWLSALIRNSRGLTVAEDASPSAASIDLGRVGSLNSRSWRDVEQLVDQAAEACHGGFARAATIAELAAELADHSAARPQRSILKIAA
jgi:hypothetical protein